ncbi:MAG: hypothetical protein AAFQ02_06580 [Bacteroidota bacterium]
MRLIVEAGSTKTHSAVLLDNGRWVRHTTPGINPVTDGDAISKLLELLASWKTYPVDRIFYYGSGCINTAVIERIASVFRENVSADVHVQDDLLGAARATAGVSSGIVAIIGTGSNTGYYDGQQIQDGIQSCGYLLGDEGSGYRFGQQIYTRWCRGQLSSELSDQMALHAGYTSERAIQNLYQHPNPRTFLASFAKFLHLLEDSERRALIRDVFSRFVEQMALPLARRYNVPIHFVGSIAYHLRQELRDILLEYDIRVGSLLQSPIAGLIKYHEHEKGD